MQKLCSYLQNVISFRGLRPLTSSPGALPLDPVRALPSDSRYMLALCARHGDPRLRLPGKCAVDILSYFRLCLLLAANVILGAKSEAKSSYAVGGGRVRACRSGSAAAAATAKIQCDTSVQ